MEASTAIVSIHAIRLIPSSSREKMQRIEGMRRDAVDESKAAYLEASASQDVPVSIASFSFDR
jgi:hypothetical protein